MKKEYRKKEGKQTVKRKRGIGMCYRSRADEEMKDARGREKEVRIETAGREGKDSR